MPCHTHSENISAEGNCNCITNHQEDSMNINKAVDKSYEGKSLSEIADSPVDALQGVSENDARLLAEAFNVKTVKDLANLKFVRWAQAIVSLIDGEE